MDYHDIVVIGSSLGGVEALPRLLGQLPADLPAAVFIVQHTADEGPGLLGSILDRACPLPVANAQDNQPIEHGRVYVAPPGRHMLVRDGTLKLVRGPKENATRPAIDPLFRSAAAYYGPRVVGVILTGRLDDGSAGLLAIKRCNGVTVVQEPGDAFCDQMPSSALTAAEPVDYQLAIAEMGAKLHQLSRQPAGERVPVPKEIQLEVRMTEKMNASAEDVEQIGTLVPVACPECGGPLWEQNDKEIQRFRCHVGHAYSALSLLAKQSEDVEKSLWMTLRALDERAQLLLRMADEAITRGRRQSANWYTDSIAEVKRSADEIRNLLAADL